MEIKLRHVAWGLPPEEMMPIYSTAGAAAMDFVAQMDGEAHPHKLTEVPLGWEIELPQGHAMLLTTRSGHGRRNGAGVPHGYGLIDEDYRGEIMLIIQTMDHFRWKAGDRIAQGLIIPVVRPAIVVVQSLSETGRGAGGFGSTGA